jgi:hypothetical protein
LPDSNVCGNESVVCVSITDVVTENAGPTEASIPARRFEDEQPNITDDAFAKTPRKVAKRRYLYNIAKDFAF